MSILTYDTDSYDLDKDYMLSMLSQRIKELDTEYRCYINLRNVSGKDITYESAKVLRSNNRKDYGAVKLLYTLLRVAPDSFKLDDDELCKAFMRIIEPNKRGKIRNKEQYNKDLNVATTSIIKEDYDY